MNTKRAKATKNQPSPQTGERSLLQARALDKLLDEWMADESGYDEETWPQLKKGLERNRSSNRKLFRE